jgi:hypothetical protein
MFFNVRNAVTHCWTRTSVFLMNDFVVVQPQLVETAHVLKDEDVNDRSARGNFCFLGPSVLYVNVCIKLRESKIFFLRDVVEHVFQRAHGCHALLDDVRRVLHERGCRCPTPTGRIDVCLVTIELMTGPYRAKFAVSILTTQYLLDLALFA